MGQESFSGPKINAVSVEHSSDDQF